MKLLFVLLLVLPLVWTQEYEESILNFAKGWLSTVVREKPSNPRVNFACKNNRVTPGAKLVIERVLGNKTYEVISQNLDGKDGYNRNFEPKIKEAYSRLAKDNKGTTTFNLRFRVENFCVKGDVQYFGNIFARAYQLEVPRVRGEKYRNVFEDNNGHPNGTKVTLPRFIATIRCDYGQKTGENALIKIVNYYDPTYAYASLKVPANQEEVKVDIPYVPFNVRNGEPITSETKEVAALFVDFCTDYNVKKSLYRIHNLTHGTYTLSKPDY